MFSVPVFNVCRCLAALLEAFFYSMDNGKFAEKLFLFVSCVVGNVTKDGLMTKEIKKFEVIWLQT